MVFSHNLNLVNVFDCLQEWIKVDIADEKVSGWVLRKLVEFNLFIFNKRDELWSADLRKEQVKAHKLTHLFFTCSQLRSHVLHAKSEISLFLTICITLQIIFLCVIARG